MPPQLDLHQRERARIREALIGLCAERDFAAITVAELCVWAEVDTATFEAQFAGLEDCAAQILQGEYERYVREAEQACAGLTAWRDRVRATAYAMHRFLADDERVWKFVFAVVRTAGEGPQLLLGAQIEGLIDLVDEGRLEPGASAASLTRATAESVCGGIFNQIYAAVGKGTALPPEGEIVPQLMYAVVLPYLGPEVAKQELAIPPPPRPSE
jgi:AcrR family transcriptional regulator